MKGLPFLLAGLLVLPSCEKYTLNRVYRAEALSSHGHRGRDTSSVLEGKPLSDTSVYVVAVVVPESYDWRKDPSFGAVGCTVQLWKDNELQFSSEAGPGADIGTSPDSHHLAGGHLYTEKTSEEGTTICCDGKVVLRYGQREQLKGLLVKEGRIYTLGRNLDGGGFCFRRDGEPLLKRDSGEIFGDFSHPLYGRGGALYENEGAVCFSFRNAASCYCVVDGNMKNVGTVSSASRVRDLRLLGGEVYYISDYTTSMVVTGPSGSQALPSTAKWLNAELLARADGVWACAESEDRTLCTTLGPHGRNVLLFGAGNLIYSGTSEFFALGYDGGNFRIIKPPGNVIYSRDSTFLLSTSALAFAGDEPFALVNPKEKDANPFVWSGGKKTEFRMNGYLTAIEVEVSLPRSRCGSRPAAPRFAREEPLPE